MSNEPLPLRTDQVADLGFLIHNPKSCMLHDPGAGKTPTICVYFEYIWRAEGLPSIWVMPKSLIYKNKQELLRFTNLTNNQIAVVEGKNWKLEAEKRGAVVYIMTPTRFRMSWEDFPKVGAVVGDETHLFWRSNGSQQTQALYSIMRKTPRYSGMTGTIIAGRLDSAYPTVHVIEPRYYGSHQGFLNHHAHLDEYGKVTGWHSPEKLTAILSKHCIHRTFESVHGREDPVIIPELCEMSPKQRKAYDEFDKNALLELEDRFLTADNPGVAALRARQIMSHPETFGIGGGEMTGKDELLDIHLEEHLATKKPLVIYAVFKPEQDRIFAQVKAKGLRVGLLNGESSAKERGRVDLAFRSGEIDVIVGSPRIATVGYNWQELGDHELEHMVFASTAYEDDIFVQAVRRGIRGKRKKPLRVTVLQYADSIDQRMMYIVQGKMRLAKSVDETRPVYDLIGS